MLSAWLDLPVKLLLQTDSSLEVNLRMETASSLLHQIQLTADLLAEISPKEWGNFACDSLEV